MIKTLIANQNPSNVKVLENLKRETTKLQHAIIIIRVLSSLSVDNNVVIIVIFVVNVLDVNGSLMLYI